MTAIIFLLSLIAFTLFGIGGQVLQIYKFMKTYAYWQEQNRYLDKQDQNR